MNYIIGILWLVGILLLIILLTVTSLIVILFICDLLCVFLGHALMGLPTTRALLEQISPEFVQDYRQNINPKYNTREIFHYVKKDCADRFVIYIRPVKEIIKRWINKANGVKEANNHTHQRSCKSAINYIPKVIIKPDTNAFKERHNGTIIQCESGDQLKANGGKKDE